MRRTRLMIILLALLAPTVIPAWTAYGQDRPQGNIDPLEDPFMLGGVGERIGSFLEARVPMGLSGSVFVYRDGLVVLHGAYGAADRERKIPNGVATLFPVGSLEREFLFAAILRLEMDGGLRVEGPVMAAVEARRRSPGDAARGRTPREDHRGSVGDAYSGLSAPSVSSARPGCGIRSSVTESKPEARFRRTATQRLVGRFACLREVPWLLPILGPSLRKTASTLTPASMGEPSGAGIAGILTTAGDLFRWRLALQGSDPLNEAASRRLRNWLGPIDRTDGRAALDRGSLPRIPVRSPGRRETASDRRCRVEQRPRLDASDSEWNREEPLRRIRPLAHLLRLRRLRRGPLSRIGRDPSGASGGASAEGRDPTHSRSRSARWGRGRERPTVRDYSIRTQRDIAVPSSARIRTK